LQQVISGSEIRYNAELPGSADAVVRTVKEAGLEGVVAKRRDSIYRGSTRSTDWLKLKLEQSQEFVIAGYNPNAGSFQSILAGYYERDKLMFAGKVRQGFNPASRAALFNKMKRLVTARCPFCNLPTSKKSHFGEGITADDMKKLRWLKPQLVAEVRFTEWTSYGLLRHATFAGLRDDKEPAEVTRANLDCATKVRV
jgi:bifunctional non-homologous end joining protein LigD